MSPCAAIAAPIALLPAPVILCSISPSPSSSSSSRCSILKKNVRSSPSGFNPFCVQLKPFTTRTVTNRLKPLCVQLKLFERMSISRAPRVKRDSLICAAALNATCAAEQTQTITRESSTITVAPIQGKEKSPDLDDGGTGLPPRDDDGGGGGGGGGGGHWSGGFFFFGFLALLGLLKDQESEGPYREERKRR